MCGRKINQAEQAKVEGWEGALAWNRGREARTAEGIGREVRMGGRGEGHVDDTHHAVQRGTGVEGSPQKRRAPLSLACLPVGCFSLKPEHVGKPEMTTGGRTLCPLQ